MTDMVMNFHALTPALQPLAGGKGGTLAKLIQKGYPVPEGFVIFPAAFNGDGLTEEAWHAVRAALDDLRKKDPAARFAVRSSALQEDSAQASFAGAFETVLDVQREEDLRAAIQTVFRSGCSQRVQAYSAAQGIGLDQPLAVVVQRMVPAELAGVLFTADPVSGSFASMTGNFVFGLGERLVSGEADAHSFTLRRPRGSYAGPDAMRPYAAALFRQAARLEQDLGGPQDIEWAAAGGKLYLLQARPVTTLHLGNLETYEINYSLMEDALWTNTNVAEAFPDVLSPFTWSIGRQLDEEFNFIPGYYTWSGNICGRVYMNISRRISVISAVLGKDARSALKLLSDLYGEIPETIQMPLYPFSRFGVLKVMLPRITHIAKNTMKAGKHLAQFLAETPDWCRAMTARIEAAATSEELLALWLEELRPKIFRAWWSSAAGAARVSSLTILAGKLEKLVGVEDANALLSNLRGEAGLASLGPVEGIARVMNGEMRHEEYLRQYGHRGAHEYELSIAHPAEDAGWLERQVMEYKTSGVDVNGLLARQRAQSEAARERFAQRYPRRVQWLEKQIRQAAAAAQLRETARSEFVRVYRVIRTFALRAGTLSGLGEDVFFLYIDEVADLLRGSTPAVAHIPARKATVASYQALPAFPAIIRGRFDPREWARDPNRRMDYYDATLPGILEPSAAPPNELLKGYPGAAGRVEGSVRVLANPEEGASLVAGEILVAATTNIGWTPLFPKAAAVITDIGAPLSHAAIVARELGIPAVVGCGSATLRLKTGDRVLVDGGQGTVQILS